MQSPVLTRIIDHACGPLAERIDRSRMPSRMGVRRKHRDQKDRERDGSREPSDRHEDSYSAQDFARAGEIDEIDGLEDAVPAQRRRDHPRHPARAARHEVVGAHAEENHGDDAPQHPGDDGGSIHVSILRHVSASM